MEAIKAKIQELFAVSNGETKGWDEMKLKMNHQDSIMDELKTLARANKTLLGRIIKFPHADSYAMYVITKVNKKTVQIDWIDYCDAWVDSRCGKRASLAMNYIASEVRGQDRIEELFSPRRLVRS